MQTVCCKTKIVLLNNHLEQRKLVKKYLTVRIGRKLRQ